MLAIPRRRRTVRRAFASVALIAATALAGCTTNDPSAMPGMDHSSSGSTATPTASSAGTPASGAHNQADVMFAQMMIPHHQQAVEMSDLILANDDATTEVKDLANQIKAAQTPEIAQMSGWLAGWGENPSPPINMDHGMDGTMSQADMDALRDATGSEASWLFLNGMIGHHQGAIVMAEAVSANGQNPDVKALAQEIITSQKAEITTMSRMREEL